MLWRQLACAQLNVLKGACNALQMVHVRYVCKVTLLIAQEFAYLVYPTVEAAQITTMLFVWHVDKAFILIQIKPASYVLPIV